MASVLGGGVGSVGGIGGVGGVGGLGGVGAFDLNIDALWQSTIS